MKLSKLIFSTIFLFVTTANATTTRVVPDTDICKTNCVSNYVVGMKDNFEMTVERSSRDGAAIQYLIYSPTVLEGLKIDERKMAEEINDTVKITAEYFKKNSTLKGSFYANLIFYPGYKTPYQIPMNKVNSEFKEQTQKLNEMLKKESTCNKEGFCGLLAFVSIDYKDSKSKAQLDQIDFAKYFKSKVRNNFKHFPTSKTALEPLRIIMVMGTNGFHVEEEEVKSYMKNNK